MAMGTGYALHKPLLKAMFGSRKVLRKEKNIYIKAMFGSQKIWGKGKKIERKSKRKEKVKENKKTN